MPRPCPQHPRPLQWLISSTRGQGNKKVMSQIIYLIEKPQSTIFSAPVLCVTNPFPLFVIPDLTEPAPYLIRGNPVFLSWIPAFAGMTASDLMWRSVGRTALVWRPRSSFMSGGGLPGRNQKVVGEGLRPLPYDEIIFQETSTTPRKGIISAKGSSLEKYHFVACEPRVLQNCNL
jgi:hypothetical protein